MRAPRRRPHEGMTRDDGLRPSPAFADDPHDSRRGAHHLLHFQRRARQLPDKPDVRRPQHDQRRRAGADERAVRAGRPDPGQAVELCLGAAAVRPWHIVSHARAGDLGACPPAVAVDPAGDRRDDLRRSRGHPPWLHGRAAAGQPVRQPDDGNRRLWPVGAGVLAGPAADVRVCAATGLAAELRLSGKQPAPPDPARCRAGGVADGAAGADHAGRGRPSSSRNCSRGPASGRCWWTACRCATSRWCRARCW